MKGEYNQFIGEYSCACNSKFTDSIITAFDYYTSMGATYCEDQQFENSNAGRFDYAIDLMDMNPSMKDHPLETLNGTLQEVRYEKPHMGGIYNVNNIYPFIKNTMHPEDGYHEMFNYDNNWIKYCKSFCFNRSYVNCKI